MLREEQIDLRRQRARAGRFQIDNLTAKRVFSDFRVTNPETRGAYTVAVRGFDVGDNTCTCPDFKANTLGTCKHIEAVLASLEDDAPPHVRQRKATVTRPEVYLHYGEQLTLGLHLPPRHSDALDGLAKRFFDDKGLWKCGDDYHALIATVETVPEEVTIFSDALDFIDRAEERKDLLAREQELLAAIDAETPPPAPPRSGEGRESKVLLPLPASGRGVGGGVSSLPPILHHLLKSPLYHYQIRGAIFAACRGRCILGDDMGLGKTVRRWPPSSCWPGERGIERVLVVAPASVKYQWETEIRKFTDRPVQVIEGATKERQTQYEQPTFYRLVNYEQAIRDLDQLNAWQPDLIVLDEAQRIKNWEAKTSRAVKKLRSRYALVLTGTPLENKLEELYSIVQFVDDRRLRSGVPVPARPSRRWTRRASCRLSQPRRDPREAGADPAAPHPGRGARPVAGADRQHGLRRDEPEQKAPYAEQQATLARLLAEEVSDRGGSPAHARLHRQPADAVRQHVPVRQADERLAEAGGVRRADAGWCLRIRTHKAVVFSQWELMLRKAAEVLGRGRRRLHAAARPDSRARSGGRCWTDSATIRVAACSSAPTRAAPD